MTANLNLRVRTFGPRGSARKRHAPFFTPNSRHKTVTIHGVSRYTGTMADRGS
ncbi:hypothetical protein [Nocardiopsis rhodophaea]|uniref:hypothetical protein n=1 Tax=Nocardiopsis rhodophaea TaxID=280238 RepID=UPI0031E1DA85